MKDSDTPITDVSKLYSILSDPEKQKEVGNNIIKSLITNILRSKLGSSRAESKRGKLYARDKADGGIWVDIGPVWLRRSTVAQSGGTERRRKIKRPIDINEFNLTKEEKRIAKELGVL